MNSLRTDDIIGAMPRVKHMPKNLYRQQRSYPYNHSIEQYSPIKGYNTYDNYLGGKWNQSYHQKIYTNFPLSQYDHNPFLKQPLINKSTSFEDKINSQNDHRKYTQKQGKNYLQQLLKKSKASEDRGYQQDSQRISIPKERQKKEALETNYEQVKLLENVHKQRQALQYESKGNKQSGQIHSEHLNVNPNSQSRSDQKQQKNITAGRSVDSRSSITSSSLSSYPSSRSSKQKGPKNIFRGIGFNIITNSRYEYNMQTKNLPIKKEF